VLGFIPPTTAASTADPNLGLLDVINGLKAVRMYVPYFGGDANKVTVGGQSAGASMVRGECV
jgi:carboxylesterase type B